MADIGYAVGTEDSNGNFVEHGRFNNKTSSKADPVLLEHADSGNTAELGSDRLEVTGADLRLDTGQAIEDGSGTERVALNPGNTELSDDSDTVRVRANNANHLRLDPSNGTPLIVRDLDGGFDAVKYTASASAPGTLELNNAQIFYGPFEGSDRTGQGGSAIELSNLSGGTLSARIAFTADDDGDGTYGGATVYYDDSTGELIAEVNGTTTVLAP